MNTVIPSTGENEFEIRLKKAPMVTLTGTVRNQSGATIPGANIHLGTMVYKDGTTIIRLSYIHVPTKRVSIPWSWLKYPAKLK